MEMVREFTAIKRVATLYRVSTKGQMDGDDIPMQERACRNLIDLKPEWKLVKEYTEKGVSGFKVSAANRDIIQQAKEDAENGLYDVLLVFMFDRLGRKDDETPFVLEWFVSKGIEMWSVNEGQQKIEQHTDRLVNYLRFWQSSGESRKTSERVTEKHKQMVEDGIFRGGGIPYGYIGVDSGVTNKKGKPLLKMALHEEESKIVKKIYELALYEGYGQLRIAKYLNELDVPARKAKSWGSPTVNVILKNPIYKGVMRYRTEKGETLSQENPEIVIVSEQEWNQVQLIRESKNPKNYGEEENNTPMSTKGKLLFIGMARCGCCHSRFTSTYFTNKYRGKNAEKAKIYSKTMSYRCSGKLQGKTGCDGQSTFAQTKVEGVVMKKIYGYLDQLNTVDLTTQIQNFKKKNSNDDDKHLKKLQSSIEEFYEELSALNAEVPRAIMGKSSFKPELLNNLIESKNNEIAGLRIEIELLEKKISSKKFEENEMEELKKITPIWKDVFEKASIEKKKMMLATIIDTIYVSKEGIEINLRLHINDFINQIYCDTTTRCSPS
ncbi:hypothetical protein BC351_10735 [Paenibacillus ferrarius]|uniref:Resolvase n=1 Tax=Paenibacillus ferrarius TaxID=1469647 RepID=A0A1V4HAA6_9BACL|nr:recombinase family protein [Paenibacillus ferrarius]OPH47657.1 hypothetical protein BC351_10735 [Paenibacillus ferrarius]